MSITHDERAEVEAAKQRLKRFCKIASECTNYHDPERMRRTKEGREHEPHGVSWRELARRLRTQ